MTLLHSLHLLHTLSLENEMATHSSILAGESYGWRSLVGHGPWGRRESDMAEVTKRTIFSNITKNLLKYQTVSVISKIMSPEIYLSLFFFNHMATSIIVSVIHGKLYERLDDINVVIK